MFRWLFRKKKDINTMGDNGNSNKNSNGIPKEALAKLKIPRKFEIYVEEYTEGDVGCQAGWRPVSVDSKLGGNGGNPIITVNSQADLQEKQNLYKMAGQRFTIVREIDPPSFDDIRKAAVKQGLIPEDSGAERIDRKNNGRPPKFNDAKTEPAKNIEPANTKTPPDPEEKRETKYYKIGDVEIKEENGKLYQKQWLRLSPAEASNFRMVSDSSNKIVSMKGKHLEAKKWAAIEHADGDSADSKDIINV